MSASVSYIYICLQAANVCVFARSLLSQAPCYSQNSALCARPFALARSP